MKEGRNISQAVVEQLCRSLCCNQKVLNIQLLYSFSSGDGGLGHLRGLIVFSEGAMPTALETLSPLPFQVQFKQ